MVNCKDVGISTRSFKDVELKDEILNKDINLEVYD